jgi:hypothetical protein
MRNAVRLARARARALLKSFYLKPPHPRETVEPFLTLRCPPRSSAPRPVSKLSVASSPCGRNSDHSWEILRSFRKKTIIRTLARLSVRPRKRSYIVINVGDPF